MSRRVIFAVVFASALALLLVTFGVHPLAFVHLLFGWIGYLINTLPRIAFHWPNVAWGTFVLLAFSVGLHQFCCWFYEAFDENGDNGAANRIWPKRWTVAIVGVVITMFVSGIALVGVVHQITWLSTTDEPLVGYDLKPARVTNSLGNLKDIGLGERGYYISEQQFPPGVTLAEDGTWLYGWPVPMLPYLDGAGVHQAIHKNVPWDHPVNKEPLTVSLPVFHSLGFDDSMRVNSNGYATIHYAANSNVLFPGSRMRDEDISDGREHTLLFWEISGKFQPWGSPFNLRDPGLGLNQSPKGFGSAWTA